MKLFGKKTPHTELVTAGQFELERDGQVATLDYTLAGNILELIHTEVPEALRGEGIASTLVKTALDYAREKNMKVDVVCPLVAGYIENHPEYQDLVLR